MFQMWFKWFGARTVRTSIPEIGIVITGIMSRGQARTVWMMMIFAVMGKGRMKSEKLYGLCERGQIAQLCE